jgi:NAD(P)-dependent dehydrogenase (short-subunit alcohol dehydrogenase family)
MDLLEGLKGKVCVITGGGGVIGLALAKGLGFAGIQTAILDINAEIAEKAAKEVESLTGTRTIPVAANVLDKQSLIDAKKIVNEKLGKIDFLINGAGGNSPKATTGIEKMEKKHLNELEKTFFGLQVEGFDFVLNLNLKGTVLPTMVFATDLIEKEKGSILNISSMNSFKPLTKIPAYSAAKGAVNNFTQWLAVHLAKTGVRVNAIAPGFFLTNQNRFLLTDEKTGKLTARGENIIHNTPVEKFGSPEDLVGGMLFLLSDMSSFITGVILPVDGGYSAFGGV